VVLDAWMGAHCRPVGGAFFHARFLGSLIQRYGSKPLMVCLESTAI
jgi:hypothetical protein